MMKRYDILSLAAVLLGSSVLPSAAGLGGVGVGGVTTVGTGARGSAVAITVPGYGNGNPAFVATRASFSRGNRGGSFSGVQNNIPGVTTVGTGVTGGAVSITVPGYGDGYPAFVATNATFSNDPRGRFNRTGNELGRRNSGRRGNDCNNNGGLTVIYPDNGYFGNYNNSNYLGLPPWYRLNYYTPWMSDYENGTAYQNIPTSHASLGYGVPEDFPGATSYRIPNQQLATSAGYQAPADVDFVVAVQRELRRRGFYRGIVNGMSDASTRAAIRAYEASAGLPVTGVIGIPLLRTLRFL